MEILVILFFIFLIAFNKNDEDLENDDLNWRKDYREKEEQFYHPVTGYKGTKSEMDVYIMNRERKINEKN
jgi:hypothetical protein